MSNHYRTQKHQLLWLLSQAIVLIICISYLYYHYTQQILPDKRAQTTFKQTKCLILNKKLNIKGMMIHLYRADFLVNYTVNKAVYQQWLHGNGLDTSFTNKRVQQEDLLSQFEVGDTYPCYYSSEDPEIAYLVRRHDWFSIFPLMLPAAVGLIAAYFMLLNLFGLFNKNKLNSSSIKKSKKQK